MADYDAIVVGSGHNGLVCALALARRGWRVVVLEREAKIGGGLRTEEVTLPGFKHDLFATSIGHFLASPAAKEFAPDFAKTSLKILANPLPYATAYRGGEAAQVYCDGDLTERNIAKFSKPDVENWRNLLAFFRRTSAHFLPLQFVELPSMEMASHLRAQALSNPFDAWRLVKLSTQTMEAFVNGHFEAAQIKDLFTPWGFHLDFGPQVRGGATFALIAAMSSHLHGLRIAEGGAANIVHALEQSLQAYGGEVRRNEEVLSIEIRNNRAVAVRTSAGHEITAERAVVANVTPRLLFGKLIAHEHVPSGFLRKMTSFRHGVGTFVVYLALRRALDWAAAEDLSRFGYVHVNGTAEDIQRTFQQASDGLLPDRPLLIVSQTSHLDPTRAPEGYHAVRLHARAFPAQIRGDGAGVIRSVDWDTVKEQMADRLMDILAEHTLNLKEVTMARHVVSPLDLERFNPNSIGGDCNGGSHQLDQNFFFRPALGWSRYRTPIAGLYMIGASQWPGGGVNGASGYSVARHLTAHG
jgi:phytoene dehydrogenase-like protein